MSGTADSWRRGQSSVGGEARESPGLTRVHMGVDVMRIALFTDSYLPTVDGVVTSVLTTRRQLEANGHEVVVFAPEDPRGRGKREAGTIYVRAKEFAHYPGYRLAMFPGRETDRRGYRAMPPGHARSRHRDEMGVERERRRPACRPRRAGEEPDDAHPGVPPGPRGEPRHETHDRRHGAVHGEVLRSRPAPRPRRRRDLHRLRARRRPAEVLRDGGCVRDRIKVPDPRARRSACPPLRAARPLPD